jgi:hypothetical protein
MIHVVFAFQRVLQSNDEQPLTIKNCTPDKCRFLKITNGQMVDRFRKDVDK